MHGRIRNAFSGSSVLRLPFYRWTRKQISRLAIATEEFEDTSQIFSHDYFPSRALRFSKLLRQCADGGDLYTLKLVHSELIIAGLQHNNVFLQNRLVNAYGKSGKLSDARHVFDNMPKRNTVSWNTLIVANAKAGHADDACKLFEEIPKKDLISWNTVIAANLQSTDREQGLKYFRRMLKAGVNPDRISFTGALSSCIPSHGKFGKQTHACVIKSGFESCVFVGSVLVDMYSKCGFMDDANQVFDEMPNKNVVSWTSMISGNAQNGREDTAMKLFCGMLRGGMLPDQLTYSVTLSGCCGLGYLEIGRQMHACVLKSGFVSELRVCNALVSMYSRCGSVGEASTVFDRITRKDSVSWNAIISGNAQHGHGQEALQLFHQMLDSGVKPDEITFVGVLSACTHTGRVEEGFKYFELMQSDNEIMPKPDHYACMIDLLGRVGRLQEAETLLQSMPFEPDVVIWSSLLSACRKHGDTRLGKLAAQKLIQLRPDNDSSYVLLANVYAALENWDEVAKLWKMMKDSGVKKKPGISWILVNQKVHSFTVSDRRHPQSDEIYGTIERLARQMEAAGYKPDTKLVLHDTQQDQKKESLLYHSERLALAYGIMTVPEEAPIRIDKNIRVCGDCHTAIKFISKLVGREIILKDNKRFHHFNNGSCSCNDFW